MANPVATADDIAARWRPLSGNEETAAVALLDDAWAFLTNDTPTLVDQLEAETIDEAVVRAVLCAMVLRVLRNPDGKVQESIDDYAYRRADAVADGALYATPDELGRLASGELASAAFTVTPFGEPGYRTNVPLNHWELELP